MAGAYFADIGRRALLDADDEKRLGSAIEAGRDARQQLSGGSTATGVESELQRRVAEGEEAHRELVEANLRLVVWVARRHQGRGLDLLDLVQAGNVGLMRAADRFDWRLGYKFSTYATCWIRQSIARAIADTGGTIRLPVHVQEKRLALRRAEERLHVELRREPSVDELAAAVGSTPERTRKLLELTTDTVSLSRPVGDGNDSEVGDLVADDRRPEPAEEIERMAERRAVRRLLEDLPGPEAEVLQLRYGIDGGRPLTLEEVGHRLGVTRGRVRQIEDRALNRLRRHHGTEALRRAS